eukprot:scaffold308_cov120-Isochrysis_galbana.AAC.3
MEAGHLLEGALVQLGPGGEETHPPPERLHKIVGPVSEPRISPDQDGRVTNPKDKATERADEDGVGRIGGGDVGQPARQQAVPPAEQYEQKPQGPKRRSDVRATTEDVSLNLRLEIPQAEEAGVHGGEQLDETGHADRHRRQPAQALGQHAPPAEDEARLGDAVEAEQKVKRRGAAAARLQPDEHESAQHRQPHRAARACHPPDPERPHSAVQGQRRVGDGRGVAVGRAGDEAEAHPIDSERVRRRAARQRVPPIDARQQPHGVPALRDGRLRHTPAPRVRRRCPAP